MADELRGYAVLLGASIRSALAYWQNSILGIVAALLTQGAQLVFLTVALSVFPVLSGWRLADVVLLYGVRMAAHGLFVVFFGGVIGTDVIVRSGDCDHMRVRPLSLPLQIMSNSVSLMAVGDLLLGTGSLGLGLWLSRGSLGATGTAIAILATLGGVCVEGAIQLFLASFAFRDVATLPVRILADGINSQLGGLPISIFPVGLQWLFFTALPVAYIAYLPLSLLRAGNGLLAFAASGIGIVLLTCAFYAVDRAARRYESAL